jgi:hypothetical protein
MGLFGFSNCFFAVLINFSASPIGISAFSHSTVCLFSLIAFSFCSIKSFSFSTFVKGLNVLMTFHDESYPYLQMIERIKSQY